MVVAFPDGQSALNLAATWLRHIASTAWSPKGYLFIVLKDKKWHDGGPGAERRSAQKCEKPRTLLTKRLAPHRHSLR